MSSERIRTFIGDIANTAAVVALLWAVIDGRPSIAVTLGAAGLGLLALDRLVVRPGRYFGLLERRRIRRFLDEEAARFRQELPAGAAADSGITLDDFLNQDSLFAEPWVEVDSGPAPTDGFVSWITERSAAVDRVLILGDPGQGKTLALQLAYYRLLESYRRRSRGQALPVFVRLVDARERLLDRPATGRVEDALAAILGHASNLPLSTERLANLFVNRRVLLLLDGLDEFAFHGGSAEDTFPKQLRIVLQGRVVLTCRRTFHDLYLRNLPDVPRFEAVATIRGIDFHTSGRAFIRRYCHHFDLGDGDELVSMIDSSRALSDLVTRPLILFMTTDILAHELSSLSDDQKPYAPQEWTVAEVYESYTRKWLHLERAKGAKLHWEVMEQLCEAVAWRIFRLAFDGNRAFGGFEVRDLVLNRANVMAVIDESPLAQPRQQVFTELTDRSFLLRSEPGGHFRFAHKSFFEYFAARYVRTALSQAHDGPDRLVGLLNAPLPDEIIDFLRLMLARCALVQTECRAVRDNLFAIVEAPAARLDTDDAVMLRQQAANLLPIVLQDDTQIRRLRALHDRELHPFVRRGIAVGFALHLRDGALIKDLLRDFDTEPDALAFHMGYNRIYYGDQVPGANGWRDDGGAMSERFFVATIRQLENPFYEYLWPMSVRTALLLLSNSGRREHLELTLEGFADHIAMLQRFADAHADDPLNVLAAECRALRAHLSAAVVQQV